MKDALHDLQIRPLKIIADDKQDFLASGSLVKGNYRDNDFVSK